MHHFHFHPAHALVLFAWSCPSDRAGTVGIGVGLQHCGVMEPRRGGSAVTSEMWRAMKPDLEFLHKLYFSTKFTQVPTSFVSSFATRASWDSLRFEVRGVHRAHAGMPRW